MKCEHCGSNLSIENKFCPSCGQPNKHYVQHREDMERYDNDYKETKEEVLAKTKWYNNMALVVTIIAILVAVNIGLVLVNKESGRISDYLNKKENEKHFDEYSVIIDKMIEDRDYCELVYFMESKKMSIPDDKTSYSPYKDVCKIAIYYEDIYTTTMNFASGEKYNGVSGYAQSVADNMLYVYKMADSDYDPYSIDPKRRTEEKQQFIDDCIADCEYIIKAQAGFTDEQMEDFRKASSARRAIMIEEGIYNYGK